jgi:hypothetical protein
MSFKKAVLIALAASAFCEICVWTVISLFHHGEWDFFTSLFIATHLGTILLSHVRLDCPWWFPESWLQPLFFVLAVLCGLIQWFIIFFSLLLTWLGLAKCWRKVHRHEKRAA